MKMKIVLATAIGVLAVAAVAAVPVIERHAAGAIERELERDGNTDVGAVEVGLFGRQVTLTDLRSRHAGKISASRWHASGLSWPLAELLRGRTPLSGWRLGDPLQADRIEVAGLTITDGDDGRLTIGEVVIEGLDLASYDPDVGASDNRAIALGARALQSVSVRRFEEKNVSYTLDDDEPTATIASLVLENVTQGEIGSFAMTGFALVEAPGGAPVFRVADVKGKALDLMRILAALASPDWTPGSPTGRIHLASLDVSGFSGSLLERYGISLERVTHESRPEGEGLLRSTTRVAGFALAPPQHGAEAMMLRMAMQPMGLDELKLEFDCSGIEDRVKGEVVVDKCVLAGPELAELQFTLKLSNADEAFWRAIDDGDGEALLESKAALSAAKLAVVDTSLVDRTLRAIAATSGQPVAETRSELAREVRRFQPSGVLITERMTTMLDTVARFIERGGTLTVEARPDPPFGADRLPYLMTPGPDLVDVLGLSVTRSR